MKLFSKIAALSVGLAMAVGVGVAVGSKRASEVKAADSVVGNWTQVTSTSDLAAGDKIVIVSNTGSNYLGITTSSGHFSGITFNSSVTDADNGVITLETTGTANRYKLASAGSDGYIIATKKASGGGAFAATDTSGWDLSYNSGWDIIYNSNTAYLRVYNETFRTYAGKSNQAALIYKYSGTPVQTHSVIFNANAEGVTDMPSNLTGKTGEVSLSGVSSPKREGYSFKGWSLTEDGAVVPSVTVSNADVNVYAIWAEKSASGGYELFTGAIEEGDYIIYYNGYAMNTTVSSDRIQYEEVTPVDDTIEDPSEDIVWHIAQSGDYWTLYNEKVNKYAASTGAKNKAQMLSDGTDNKSLWSISGSETYEFVNKQNTTNGVNANLRNNGTYGFACYATSTGGALSLYKSGGSSPTKVLESVTIEKDDSSVQKVYTEGNSASTAGLTVTAHFDDTTTQDVTSAATITPTPATVSLSTSSISYVATYKGFTSDPVVVSGITVNELETTSLSDFYDGTITLKTSASSLTDSDYYLFKGVVVGINGYQYYIQDGEYGILIFNNNASDKTYYEGVALGDYVRVYSQVFIYTSGVVETNRGTEKQYVEKLGVRELPDAVEFSTVASFMAGNQSVRASLSNTKVDSDNLTAIAAFTGTSGDNQQFVAYDANSSSDKVTVFISRSLDSTVKTAIVAKLKQITADDTVDYVRTVVSYYKGNQISLSSADQIVIHTPEEDKITAWGVNYLFIGDEDFDGDGEGLCRTSGLYKEAKKQLFILEGEESGSIEKLQTEEEYALELARYEAWAVACGDYSPFVEDYNFSNIIGGYESTIDSSSSITIIVVVAVTSMTLLGVTLVLRKRKHQ